MRTNWICTLFSCFRNVRAFLQENSKPCKNRVDPSHSNIIPPRKLSVFFPVIVFNCIADRQQEFFSARVRRFSLQFIDAKSPLIIIKTAKLLELAKILLELLNLKVHFIKAYTLSNKKPSTLLHTCVMNEYLTACSLR